MMLIFMLALTGILPTGGFVGKFYLFAAAIQAGWTWVAVVGVLMSAVSLYYYLIVMYMYQRAASRRRRCRCASRRWWARSCSAARDPDPLGIYPGPFIEFAKSAVLLP